VSDVRLKRCFGFCFRGGLLDQAWPCWSIRLWLSGSWHQDPFRTTCDLACTVRARRTP
jgi:hypothetical protein